MIGSSYVSRRSSMTVDYPATDLHLCLLRHVHTQVTAMLVRRALQKSGLPEPEKSTHDFVENYP